MLKNHQIMFQWAVMNHDGRIRLLRIPTMVYCSRVICNCEMIYSDKSSIMVVWAIYLKLWRLEGKYKMQIYRWKCIERRN